jgi:hypothetical protein
MGTQITGGVDTHLEVHVAAALDDHGGLLGTASFATTPDGYRELVLCRLRAKQPDHERHTQDAQRREAMHIRSPHAARRHADCNCDLSKNNAECDPTLLARPVRPPRLRHNLVERKPV